MSDKKMIEAGSTIEAVQAIHAAIGAPTLFKVVPIPENSAGHAAALILLGRDFLDHMENLSKDYPKLWFSLLGVVGEGSPKKAGIIAVMGVGGGKDAEPEQIHCVHYIVGP